MTAVLTYGQAFGQGVREEMEQNERIFVMGTDLLDRGGNFGQLPVSERISDLTGSGTLPSQRRRWLPRASGRRSTA